MATDSNPWSNPCAIFSSCWYLFCFADAHRDESYNLSGAPINMRCASKTNSIAFEHSGLYRLTLNLFLKTNDREPPPPVAALHTISSNPDRMGICLRVRPTERHPTGFRQHYVSCRRKDEGVKLVLLTL
jgi:hypothetical protein